MATVCLALQTSLQQFLRMCMDAMERLLTCLGECRFEHPQNVVLGQVIATNMELENLAGDKDPELVGGPMAAEARLARTLRLWLELQACVSGFIDSTAADKDVMARSRLHLQPLVVFTGSLGMWLSACFCSLKPSS